MGNRYNFIGTRTQYELFAPDPTGAETPWTLEDNPKAPCRTDIAGNGDGSQIFDPVFIPRLGSDTDGAGGTYPAKRNNTSNPIDDCR